VSCLWLVVRLLVLVCLPQLAGWDWLEGLVLLGLVWLQLQWLGQLLVQRLMALFVRSQMEIRQHSVRSAWVP
jgi:hypothetical protein